MVSTLHGWLKYDALPAISVLEIDREGEVELTAGEIVGNGPFLAGDVAYPVVGIGVVDAQQVEAIQADPDVFDASEPSFLQDFVLAAHQQPRQTDVHAAVGLHAVHGIALGHGRRTEAEAVGPDHPQGHGVFGIARQVVAEEHGHIVALLVGAGNGIAVDALLAVHQREGDPGIGAGDELAEELKIAAHGLGFPVVDALIADAYVVDRVGYQVVHFFEVGFGRELEGPFPKGEVIVGAQDGLGRFGRADVVVEHHRGDAAHQHRVAYFLVEGGLVVDAAGQPEHEVFFPGRDEAGRQTRTQEPLAVETPPLGAHTGRQAEQAAPDAGFPGVLHIGGETMVVEGVFRTEVLDEIDLLVAVGQAVAGRIAHLPFAQVVVEALPLPGQAPAKMVGVGLPLAVVGYVQNGGRQTVAGMLVIGADTDEPCRCGCS